MAAFEPFFFHTQGHGVIYLATQYATMDEYSGQTYIATGAFQNINTKSDGKRIYSIDGRYTDQMNEASMFGRVNVQDTEVMTKAKMKKFIKDQGIQMNPDGVKLFFSGDMYWFVKDGVLEVPRSKSRSRSRSRSRSKSANSGNGSKTGSKSRSKSKSRSRSKSKKK